MEQPHKRIKCVCVGDGATGKTCLLTVFKMGKFPTEYIPTVFETYVADIMIGEKHIELALWDTAGQEDFDRLRPLSYHDTDVIMICFGIDSPDSLDNVLTKWIAEVRHHCGKIPIILVGCKKDVRNDQRVLNMLAQEGKRPLTPQEGESVREQIGADRFVECSASTGENVHQVFEVATRLALGKKEPGRTGKCKYL
ncbi:GTP-binding protein rhoA [Meredithblackwellia eburnea MCA 4105]